MPTVKTRLNITLSPEMERGIRQLAERDRASKAGKAAELLRVALEIEEDRVWDKLAAERDSSRAKFMPHEKAWR